jgi:hypothetical protein
VILWLLSVQLFGAIVFFQRGATSASSCSAQIVCCANGHAPQHASFFSPARSTCMYPPRARSSEQTLTHAGGRRQIEYLIIALLLKSSGLKALVYAYVGGTILYTVQMFVKDCMCARSAV